MRGGIEGGKPEGDDPAQHELDEDVVNGERIAAEGEHVEYRRHNPHPVFKPERNSREDEKHSKINHGAAGDHQREPEVVRGPPREMQPPDANLNHQQARHHLLQRFDPEFLKEHLEQRIHRPQQDAVEAPLDDVNVAKFVQVPAHHVEEAERDQREGIEEQDFVKRPALELRDFGKQYQHESKAQHRGRHGREEGDEEVRLVRQADLRVLGEVEQEEFEVALHKTEVRSQKSGVRMKS